MSKSCLNELKLCKVSQKHKDAEISAFNRQKSFIPKKIMQHVSTWDFKMQNFWFPEKVVTRASTREFTVFEFLAKNIAF